jgi:hypothetical protein
MDHPSLLNTWHPGETQMVFHECMLALAHRALESGKWATASAPNTISNFSNRDMDSSMRIPSWQHQELTQGLHTESSQLLIRPCWFGIISWIVARFNPRLFTCGWMVWHPYLVTAYGMLPWQQTILYGATIYFNFIMQILWSCTHKRSQKKHQCLRPYHTSALSREDWVQELIYSHPNHIKTGLGMCHHIFKNLLKQSNTYHVKNSLQYFV